MPNILIFARGFLSKDLHKSLHALRSQELLFLVVNKKERKNVLSILPNAKVFLAQSHLPGADRKRINVSRYDDYIKKDRYLSAISKSKAYDILKIFAANIQQILASNSIDLVLDEPVSGARNELLHDICIKNGIKIFHYQSTWLPEYIFFTEDKAQDKPRKRLTELNIDFDQVRDHWKARLNNLEEPKYVQRNTKKLSVSIDILKLSLSIIKKKIWPNGRDPIDTICTAEIWDIRCKLAWLIKRPTAYSSLETFALDCDTSDVLVFPLHFEPEAIFGYLTPVTDQSEYVEILLRNNTSKTIYLKEHPSQMGALMTRKWLDKLKFPNLKFLKPDIHMSELSDLNYQLQTLGSTAALEAALAGKQVEVNGSPHFKGIISLDDLEGITIKEREEFILRMYHEFMKNHAYLGSIIPGEFDIAAFIKEIKNEKL